MTMARLLAIAAAGAVALALGATSTVAHRTTISPYTYYRDLRPIFAARCGSCHDGDGGVSGIPLLRFIGARDNTWAIRRSVIGGHMPPWFADGDVPFKAPGPVTAQELNMLLTWASSGAPDGPPVPADDQPPRPAWPLGPPDLILPMPAPVTLDRAQPRAVHEVRLQHRDLRGRLIRAADLRASSPAIVRRAEIVIVEGHREHPIALWQPGDAPQTLEAGAAFRVPSNGTLLLRMHYQRAERLQAALTDQSEVGVYFAPPGAAIVRSIDLRLGNTQPVTTRIDRESRGLAVRPVAGPSGTSVQLTAIQPDRSRTVIARVQFRDRWERRYVFVSPLPLPRGTIIEATSTPPLISWTSLTGEPFGAVGETRIAIDLVH
jgi:hypothetical protein